jgi:hypothetical protein
MAGAFRSQGPAHHCAGLVHIRIALATLSKIAVAAERLPQSDRCADRFASAPLSPLSIAMRLG